MRKIVFTYNEFLDIRRTFIHKVKLSSMPQDVDPSLYLATTSVSTAEALFNVNRFRIEKRAKLFESVFTRYLQIVLGTKKFTQTETFDPPCFCFQSILTQVKDIAEHS